MMLRSGGYAVSTDLEGRVSEADSFTCAHCNSVTLVRAGQRAADLGGFCRLCSKLICSKCAGGDCTPFEKKLQQMEERARRGREFSCW
jgi:hypothetical protein